MADSDPNGNSPEQFVESQAMKLLGLAEACDELADEGGEFLTVAWLRDVAREMRTLARGNIANAARTDGDS